MAWFFHRTNADGTTDATRQYSTVPDLYLKKDCHGGRLGWPGERCLIQEMAVGESGWTVPWAMQVDESKHGWMDPCYSVLDEPEGTIEMHITRRRHGFVVRLAAESNFKWTPRNTSAGLPVIAFTIADPDDTQPLPALPAEVLARLKS